MLGGSWTLGLCMVMFSAFRLASIYNDSMTLLLVPFRSPLSVDPPKVRILSSGPTARARSGKRHSELPCYESRASPPMRLSARVRSPFLRSDPNDCDSFYAHCRPNVIQFHNVFRILCSLIGLCRFVRPSKTWRLWQLSGAAFGTLAS